MAMPGCQANRLSARWDAHGQLTEFVVDRAHVPQAVPAAYYLNGSACPAVTSSARDDVVRQAASSEEGELRVVWQGGDRLRVTVEADASSGVSEAGFSMMLPKGTLISGNGSRVIWDETAVGHRCSFDDMYGLSMLQFFLLELADGAVLRIGRQVERKADYTTGWMQKHAEGWLLVWKWEPERPFPNTYRAQPIELGHFPSWREAVAEHRRWMQQTFPLTPKERHRYGPRWVPQVPLILQVELGGSSGAVCHDYFDIGDLLEEMHRHGIPEHTMVYLPDYNFQQHMLKGCNSPVCCNWPESPFLGGRGAFVQMVETSKRFGYHLVFTVTIAFLVDRVRMDFQARDAQAGWTWLNPEWYEWMDQFALRDVDGNVRQWPPVDRRTGWDGAMSADIDGWSVAYFNIAHPEVQQYCLDTISAFINEYGVEAVQLDSLSDTDLRVSAYNLPTQGTERSLAERKVMEELLRRHPDTLFWAERLLEETSDLSPMMMWHYPPEYGQFTAELFGENIFMSCHIGHPSPFPMRRRSYLRQVPDVIETELEAIRTVPNHIPRLAINYRDFGLDQRAMDYITRLLAAKS